MKRRDFLNLVAVGALGAMTARMAKADTANDRIVMGVMGIRGRGDFLAKEFAKRADVELRYLADPDSRLFESRAKGIEAITGKAPACVQDFRRMLDDPEVDAVVIATPDHWHALGTILACQAGKDVYVEKPTSHNIWESRKMIEAARACKRIVQVGAQGRSNDNVAAGIEYAHAEAFGAIHYIRVVNSKPRPPLEALPDAPTPEGVDYDLWLGPATMRPFNYNRFHGGWNWFWDYSGGDIVNDGVHQIDLARWLIGQKLPLAVTSIGGQYALPDAQETPDTMTVSWEFDGLAMALDEVQWAPYLKKTPLDQRDTDGIPNWPFNGTRVEVYGTKQMMYLGRHGDGWQAFDGDGNAIRTEPGVFTPSNTKHIGNFLDCIRSRNTPTADIEELHYSTLLCHYANIAYRTKSRLQINPDTEGFVASPEANALVKRDYRGPWVIPGA